MKNFASPFINLANAQRTYHPRCFITTRHPRRRTFSGPNHESVRIISSHFSLGMFLTSTALNAALLRKTFAHHKGCGVSSFGLVATGRNMFSRIFCFTNLASHRRIALCVSAQFDYLKDIASLLLLFSTKTKLRSSVLTVCPARMRP